MKKFEYRTYRITLKPDVDGGYTVQVPELRGVITHGRTIKEAKAMAKEAIELYFEVAGDRQEASPPKRAAAAHTTTVQVRVPLGPNVKKTSGSHGARSGKSVGENRV